jgi:hypothetical protein
LVEALRRGLTLTEARAEIKAEKQLFIPSSKLLGYQPSLRVGQ